MWHPSRMTRGRPEILGDSALYRGSGRSMTRESCRIDEVKSSLSILRKTSSESSMQRKVASDHRGIVVCGISC